MTHRQRLKCTSLTFAVFWTCLMVWTLSPLKLEQLGMLALSGVLAGLAWHWAFALWYRWRLFPRKRAA
jgi:hypothetical protein